MDEFKDITKLKKEKAFSIRKILNRKDLDEFELDLVMNDLI